MDEYTLKDVKNKIAENMDWSVEELDREFDKLIVTKKKNKEQEQLFLLRDLKSKNICGEYYSTSAKYSIFTKNGKEVGYVDVYVSNVLTSDRAEIIYNSSNLHRGKGNMTIALEEVLEDVFINKAFDGFPLRPSAPKTKIKTVFLAIHNDNVASRAVAYRNGFEKTNRDCYEITEAEFKKRISNGSQNVSQGTASHAQNIDDSDDMER